MDPRLRTSLVFVSATLLAVMLGWQVAEGSYLLPAFAAAIVVASTLVRYTKIPADAIFLGLIVFGYVVGNRGFAQLTPARGLPLFPAEACLLIAVTWRIIACGFERRLPLRKDALNYAILGWLFIGTARIFVDVPRFGFEALRDYAVVYYAVFFFLAQHMAKDSRARKWLIGSLIAGVVVLGPMFALFSFFEAFFFNHLSIAGAPVIYYKGDIAATHLGAGSLILFHWARGKQRYWAYPLSVGMFLFVMSWDSRASMLGAMIGTGLLVLTRHWRYPVVQAACAAVALCVVVMLAVVFGNEWADRKVHGLTDRARSFVDLAGTSRYESEESSFKGDNNRFRYVWWKNVVDETWSTNPVFGLGLGADLTHSFLREYAPEPAEEFSARSPHNIFLTVFGRMGIIGVIFWGAVCATLLSRTWHVLKTSTDPLDWGLWTAPWVILVSASFGVVLEGPMGAVIFWSVIGLAHRKVVDAETATETEKSDAVPNVSVEPAHMQS